MGFMVLELSFLISGLGFVIARFGFEVWGCPVQCGTAYKDAAYHWPRERPKRYILIYF